MIDATWERTAPIPTGELKRLVAAKTCQHYYVFHMNEVSVVRGCSLCGQTHVALILANCLPQWKLITTLE